MFATALAIFAVAYLGLGFTTTSAWVWPLFALYGGYTALTDCVGKAWVADLLPADREAAASASIKASSAPAPSSPVFGPLAWNDNGRLPLIVSGTVVAALSLTLFAAGRRLERR